MSLPNDPSGWLDAVRSLAPYLLFAYALVVAIYIVLQNRSPQSTFAWMLLFFVLPGVGVLIYRFAGRGWRAFSRESRLARNVAGSTLLTELLPLRARYEQYVARTELERPVSFKKKMLRRLERSHSSLLTGFNEVEIFSKAHWASDQTEFLERIIQAYRSHV